MLSIVATIKVKAGSEQDFEAVAKELVAKVNANEPGCKLYTLSRSEQPQTYVFMERYVDKAATELHRGTDYFKDLGRKMGAFMDGPPVVQRMVEV
ncbi:MAG TPA: putative quinol monooxygenase [Candidatus Sulfotelmatobacter sp.]|nr:putative quinol monooxygenase [Candidatus Sulfotelmatobacter sp.]